MQLDVSAPSNSISINNVTSNAMRQPVIDSFPSDCVLIFYDAAYDMNTNSDGLGIVTYNLAGQYSGCKGQPTVTETQRKQRALQFGRHSNGPRIET